VRLQIGDDHATRRDQFPAVVAIACAAEGAEPLLGVRLQDGGAGADHLSPLASGIAWRTHRGHPAARGRAICPGGECPLSCCLPRAIDIKDEEAVALAVDQSTALLFCGATRGKIVREELAQGFQAGGIDGRQKPAECGAVRQVLTSDERHEGTCEWCHPLKESLQRRLTADRVAQQQGDKVDHLVAAHASATEMNLLTDGLQETLVGEVAGQHGDFSEPVGEGGDILR